MKDEKPEARRPTVHWSSSESEDGLCWCGEKATPEHARKANARADSAEALDTKGWRQG